MTMETDRLKQLVEAATKGPLHSVERINAEVEIAQGNGIKLAQEVIDLRAEVERKGVEVDSARELLVILTRRNQQAENLIRELEGELWTARSAPNDR